MKINLRSKIAIVLSDYGREFGWYVCDGSGPLAELVAPEWVDMFWTRYNVIELVGEPERVKKIYEADFWIKCPEMRNRRFGISVNALAAVPPNPNEKKLTLRGDYIAVHLPYLFEKGLLLVAKGLRGACTV
jgi:hypothetical protein